MILLSSSIKEISGWKQKWEVIQSLSSLYLKLFRKKTDENMKIMVVDDEQDVQFLFEQKFRRELKKNLISLDFTLSAEEALKKIQSQTKLIECLSLILADINMPGMNGLQLLKIIKQNFPNLKVFIITAYDDEDNYLIAKKYGADEYITKPIQFDKLKEKIFSA
jgi:CheY-like chemotaxis protein